jgi:hypothetical protein
MMNFLRQLLMFAIVPFVVWSGMPHVACQCSTGEVRLYCPRMNSITLSIGDTQLPKVHDVSCRKQFSGERGRCCQSGMSSCCRSAKRNSIPRQASCCAVECRCTPIYIAAHSATKQKSEDVPLMGRFEFELNLVQRIHLPRLSNVDVNTAGTRPPMPCGAVVFFERFLI